MGRLINVKEFIPMEKLVGLRGFEIFFDEDDMQRALFEDEILAPSIEDLGTWFVKVGPCWLEIKTDGSDLRRAIEGHGCLNFETVDEDFQVPEEVKNLILDVDFFASRCGDFFTE